MFKSFSVKLLLAGAVIGFFIAFLMKLGNPVNMGVCAVCFLRDTSGALKIHTVGALSYFRPEIIGFILGSFFAALIFKEFKSKAGSAPALRFFISFFVAVGALVFLGCPFRMMARIAAGDPTALFGLLGLIAGVYTGVIFLQKGFSLGRSYNINNFSKWIAPGMATMFFIFLIVKPEFIPAYPASGYAPLWISLLAGLIMGFIGLRTRVCTVGGFRDIFIMKDLHLFSGIIGILFFAFVFNLIFGQFNFGDSPGVHSDNLWNFLGLYVVGFGSCLIGGCPFRQMILAGSGNSDSTVSVLGMIVGGGLSHNFMMVSASNATISAKYGVVFAIALFFAIAIFSVKKIKY